MGVGVGENEVKRAGEGIVKRSASLGDVLLRRKTSSSLVSASVDGPAAIVRGIDAAYQDEGDREVLLPSLTQDDLPPPIQRRKSSLAALVASYTTSTASPTPSSSASTTSIPTPSSSPASYRTSYPRPASPTNPNPPTFSLPLHRASTSLAASALPESAPLVRVERICKGCAKVLRGAAGKGRSALPGMKELERTRTDSAGSTGSRSLMSLNEENESSSSVLTEPQQQPLSPVHQSAPPNRRRRSRARSTEEQAEPIITSTSRDVRRQGSRSSLVSNGSSSHRVVRMSPPTNSSSLHQHTFSPGVSSPLSPTLRSPVTGSAAGLSLPSSSSNIVSTTTTTAPPRRSQSVLLPPSSLLPAIPEPTSGDESITPSQSRASSSRLVMLNPTTSTNTAAADRKLKSALAVRPGMRRAHSSNDADLPRATVSAVGVANRNGSAKSPLARASSLRASGRTGVIKEAQPQEQPQLPKPKGRHVAWLPAANIPGTASSINSEQGTAAAPAAKPSPFRTTIAFPTPQIGVIVEKAVKFDLVDSAQTSTTVTGSSTPTATTAIAHLLPAASVPLSPASPSKSKKDRHYSSPTFTLYGGPKYGRLSLREVLQQTLGSESDDEDDNGEVDAAASQSNHTSSPSAYSDDLARSKLLDERPIPQQMNGNSAIAIAANVVFDAAAFPASPPPPPSDLPILYAPFGNGAIPAPGLLSAATSRIITPSLPPAYMERRANPFTPAPTPPITRPPSSSELSAKNKSRAEVYAAHVRYEEELATRRRMAVAAATTTTGGGRNGHSSAVAAVNQPFGYMGMAMGPGYSTTTAEKLAPPFGYGRPDPENEVRVPVAPAQQPRRDLVKPLYAMTLSTF